MAATNSVKIYLPDSYYHLYNRGVDRQEIFRDDQDYAVFLSYLKSYLLPKDNMALQVVLRSPSTTYKEKTKAARLLRMNNFSEEIELNCYALLPNHFHLLVRQTTEDTIDRFLNSFGVRYSKYFNAKYHRVGKLYQGVYKAALVSTDEQLMHLSRYIHLNPFKWLNFPVRNFSEIFFPSSLKNYLGLETAKWISTEQVLSYFSRNNGHQSYLKFLEDYADPDYVTPVALDYTEELL